MDRRPRLTLDLRTVIIAGVTAAVVMATPSIAANVTNADKVDGKDAVGAKASVDKRAGRLVNTPPSRSPNG